MEAPTHNEQSTDPPPTPGAPEPPTDEVQFPEPEDRGRATLSPLGDIEYVEDLIRPGRIVAVAAEEGTGKSFAMLELGLRVAFAGGSFAGTWPVLRTGPVLYLSEMHPDDDFLREGLVLASLGRARGDLDGRYYRLSLMTAARGRPPLMVPEWRAHIAGWLRNRGALLLIVDTATGATQVDPWGPEIQAVYAGLRLMLAEYPELAIVLLIHLKKPQGRGERRISDVLGEWGRWCDVVLMMETDGHERVRLTVSKRVRHERRIVVTKMGGLLVEPVDRDAAKVTKIRPAKVLEVIETEPCMTYADLGARLKVSPDTASRYVRDLGDKVRVTKGTARSGPDAKAQVYPAAASPHVAAQDARGDPAPTPAAERAPQDVESPHRRSTPMGAATPRAETPTVDPTVSPVGDDDAPQCDTCGRRRRAVPGRAGRYVCTFPHSPVEVRPVANASWAGPPVEDQAARS